jgi:tetratricopeptide (TPR) repeat protein
MLESGQNLNFAEPAKFVLQLLGEEISQPAQAAEASHAAAEPIKDRVNTNKTKPETLQSLLSQLEDLRNSGRLRNKDSALDAGIDAEALLIQALELAGSDASQLGLVEDVAERTSRSMGLWQTVETIAIAKIAVLAAERILKEPKFRISGYVKYANALLAQFVADTDEAHRYEDRGNAKENPTLIRAEKAIREACKLKGQPTTEMYLVLGEVLAASSQPEESRKTYIKAYERARLENDSLSIHSAIRGIINADSNLKTFVDSDHWFQTLADTEGGPIFFEWYDQAKRLSDRKEYERSGDIYVNAAAQASREGMLPWDSLCSAAEAYFRAQDADKLLDAARSCIDKAARIEGTSDRIAKAHFIIADTLNRRGVYEEGLAHANEAVALDSSDAFYYDALADSLIGLRRFKDAIKASKESVRLSDGKYSYMHFTLGTGYFELKNWDAARQSFEEAAELAPTNDAAAYNVALCLMHLGFDQDAASWYEEVLRRNPNPKQKQEILNRIRALRH